MKKLLWMLFVWTVCLSFAGCGSSGNAETPVEDPGVPVVEDVPEWAIYWYLCGSDLEGWYGCATEDLAEMMAVNLPDNVRVVIQTGGSMDWFRDDIRSDRIGRYLYDSEGFRLLEEQPQANMGQADALASFLRFCTDNYPADNTMVLFWNHGGGSVSGAAFDANYGFDSLSIPEFREAFEAVCMPDEEEPPFDIIGFDACLMATVDVADTFRELGNYLVASEELEPGNGWYYTGWLQALADEPRLSPEELSIAICDAYVEGCEQAGTADEITLSVTDLSGIDRLLEAYDDLGRTVLLGVADDPMLYASYSRGAALAENYGGNTEEEGYTNLVDLGHLSRNSILILPDSAVEVQKALEDCVIYKVNGPYRSQASGLSCFHSFDCDVENFVDYSAVGYSEAFKYLYGYGISGKISAAGLAYLETLGKEAEFPDSTDMLDISALEGMPLYVDDDGSAVLDVLPRGAESIVTIRSDLAFYDMEQDIFRFYGESGRIESDFEEGIFRAAFDGYWPSIDGNFVFTRLLYQGEDYTTYSVPVLLNGEEYNLRVVYDHELQDYTVLGARKGLTDNGMADKNLRQLVPGDVVTPIYLDRRLSASGNFDHRIGADIILTEDTAFYEAPLPEGEYGLIFRMTDSANRSAWSEMAFYLLADDAIYVY